MCLIALLIISGCIEKPQTQAEKVGWDEAKYEEYSAYYDSMVALHEFSHIRDSSRLNSKNYSEIYDYMSRQNAIHRNYSINAKGKTLDEWLIDIPKDKNEFEKAWYLVFYYIQKGQLEKEKLKRCVLLDECLRSEIDANERIKKTADGYYQKAAEYRQMIEEMKP